MLQKLELVETFEISMIHKEKVYLILTRMLSEIQVRFIRNMSDKVAALMQ